MSSYQDHIIAHYKFEDAGNIGKDYSGQGKDGIAAGLSVPSVAKVSGRNAAAFAGEQWNVVFSVTFRSISTCQR